MTAESYNKWSKTSKKWNSWNRSSTEICPKHQTTFPYLASTLTTFTGKLTSKIEDYEIIDKIGRGKYAQVFSAIQFKTGEKVALKILKPSSLKSQQAQI